MVLLCVLKLNCAAVDELDSMPLIQVFGLDICIEPRVDPFSNYLKELVCDPVSRFAVGSSVGGGLRQASINTPCLN